MTETKLHPGQRVRHRPTGETGKIMDASKIHKDDRADTSRYAFVYCDADADCFWLPLAELEALDGNE